MATSVADARAFARAVFDRMLVHADPRRLAREAVAAAFHDAGQDDRVDVLALGKAADGLAWGAAEALGSGLGDVLVVGPGGGAAQSTGYGDIGLGAIQGRRWTRLDGDHPFPGPHSFAAGSTALAWCLERDHERRRVVFLVSGGGSSMLESSRDATALPPEDLTAVHRWLVTGSGLPIARVNRIRAALSATKAGGLSRACRRAGQVTFVLSDVAPGHEAAVASGPTIDAARIDPLAPDEDELAEVLAAAGLDRARERAVRLALADPDAAVGRFDGRPGSRAVHLLADTSTVVEAVCDELAAKSVATPPSWPRASTRVVRAGAGCGDGPVAEIARAHVDVFEGAAASVGGDSPAVVVSAGEADVVVRGRGRGGRNQELALRVAALLAERGMGRVVFLSAGSDGIDGNTEAAGGVVDASTVVRAEDRLAVPVDVVLADNDSHRALEASGDLLVTGPTGTNVRDLRVGVVLPE